MVRVMIITGLRIQALHLVTSTDYTYPKGHLGLLSVLGVILGVITGGAPSITLIINKMSSKWRDPSFTLSSSRMNQFPTDTEAGHSPPSYEESQQQQMSNATFQWTNEAISRVGPTQAIVSRELAHAHSET